MKGVRFLKTLSLFVAVALVVTGIAVQQPETVERQQPSVHLVGAVGTFGISGEELISTVDGAVTPTPAEAVTVTPTPTPEVTAEPEVTPEAVPEMTTEPEVTPEAVPEMTAEPEVTPEAVPEMTAEPEVTPEAVPEVTAEPEVTPEAVPEVTAEPEVTPEAVPEVTAEPEAAPETSVEQPEAAPEMATEPEVTPEAVPEVTAEPEATPEAADEVKTPEVTGQPETAEQKSNSEAAQSQEKAPEQTSYDVSKLEKLRVTAQTGEDVQSVIDAYRWYESLSDEERDLVPRELLIRLKKAKSAVKVYNQNSNGVRVTGDLPWYVQFRVTKKNKEGDKSDLGDLLGSYEMTLWNLLEDAPYELNGGKVRVTVPVEDAKNYKKLSIIHYFSDGSYETLTPEVTGNTLSFTATSFSPYKIAGSQVLAGAGDKIYKKPGSSSKSRTGTEEKKSSNSTSSESTVSKSSKTAENSDSSSSTASSTTSVKSSKSSSSSSETDVKQAKSTDKTRNTKVKKAVNTGDENQITPYIVILIVAAILIIALIIAGRIMKKRKE